MNGNSNMAGWRMARGTAVLALAAALQHPAGALAQADTEAHENSDDIVVTAQKREEKLREVPISISAVTSDQLTSQGASRFSDYAGYIPALSYSPSGTPGGGQLNLRGVTTATSPSASTAIYIDEVATTTHGTWGGSAYTPVDLFPYDLERVEVLRGPQGTLYGDSTIGGLVKYVTKTADTDDFSAAAGVEGIAVKGGDGLGGGARAMVNVPVAPGLLGLRVSGFYQKNPGYITNIVNGRKGTNETEQRGLRVAARLTPSDDFSIDAQWLHSEIEADGRASTLLVPGTARPLGGDDRHSFRIAEPSSRKFDLLSATARYDFGPVNLTSVTGYSHSDSKLNGDNTSAVGSWIDMLTGGEITDGIALFEGFTTNRKFSQEVRLASSPDQRLSWQIGGYYTREDTDTLQRYVPFRADGTVINDLIEIYRDEVRSRYTDLSAFANATFKITDKWEVSGGIRHSRITDDFHEKATGLMLSGSATMPYFDDISTKYKATTWSLTTRYVANDDLMMFARAASGFRAGGINYTWPGAEKSYDPDSLTSYEAGVRADFMGDRATIDLTVYYLDWKDLFILAYTPDEFAFGYQTNGGKANGFGTEFTGTLRPAKGLSFTATAAYSGLKVREDLPTIGAEAGDRTPISPAWSGSFLADYSAPLSGDWDLSIGGGLRWASHSYTRFIHDPRAVRLSGYAAIDLNAAISNDRWTVRGYVRNLANNRTVLSANSQDEGVQMNPRTIGLALDMKF
jgi:outer membrane receptor protein involved in Fe transport